MIVNLDRHDLENLLRGTTPRHEIMNTALIGKAGYYTGGHHDKWTWNNDLGHFTDAAILEMYYQCKTPYKSEDPNREISIKEVEEFLNRIWVKKLEEPIPDYFLHVDVFVGWMDDHTDKVNGGFNAESYHIKSETIQYGTGRPGMKLLLQFGVPITKLTINGKDLTPRIEEFVHFVMVGDKPFKV